jgi:hypothetical protein
MKDIAEFSQALELVSELYRFEHEDTNFVKGRLTEHCQTVGKPDTIMSKCSF